MRQHFKSENVSPRSLFTHPSMTSFIVASNNLPAAARMMKVTTMISANATTFSTCSDAVIYWAIHSLTIVANLADAHTPKMSETMEITCEMNPFLSPWIIAGIRQIKIMISSIFINIFKIVYICRLKFSGRCPDCKNRQLFYNYGI